MNQRCKQCEKVFEITDQDLAFYERVSPRVKGVRYDIPPPTHCPDCRQQRRSAMCNEFFLYSGECGFCKKRTLTQYPPHLKNTYYCRECWHSDDWDPRNYGKEFDFSRPFFEQMRELIGSVPAQALHIDGTIINSEYIHYAGSAKNCYLIMHADYCEDCCYGYGFKNNKSCVDGFYNLHCELCYDCIDTHKCYDLKGSQDCLSCSSSAFLRDCIGCNNCFLSVGLRNKEYCFENKQLTKEEYRQKMSEIDLGSYEQYMHFKARLAELEKEHSFKHLQTRNVENSFGDHLVNCKNTQHSFDCEDVEDAKFCYQMVLGSKDVYDCYQYGTQLRESYECSTVGSHSYHVLFSQDVHLNSSDIFYSWYMENCKNCFGSVYMHNKSYCILNKQYSKEEYEELVPRIIEHMKKTGEWGEFFPVQFSPFGYNKTTALPYYPLEREQVLAKGWKWDDYEPPRPDVAKIIPARELPDNIKDVGDDILEAAIECEITGKPFRITSYELRFYREQRLPVPRRFPYQRHLDRFMKRNPRTFGSRMCTDCGQQIMTTYVENAPGSVVCEACYLKRVY